VIDVETRFRDLIADVKLDGRYRTFIELERIAGEFPTALGTALTAIAAASPSGAATTIAEWVSIPTC
jgi:5-aminolevulinate synthase